MRKPKLPPDGGDCCICGLPYERIGNNPEPIAWRGRCCDACNEVVTHIRAGNLAFTDVERVREAVERNMERDVPATAAVAAICAFLGPPLLARKLEERAKLDELMGANSRTPGPCGNES